MLYNKVCEVLQPVLDRHEKEQQQILENVQQRAGELETECRTLRNDVAALRHKLGTVSVTDSEESKAAQAGMALLHVSDPAETGLVANYLRSRGWRSNGVAWLPPGTGSGTFSVPQAVRMQAEWDLQPVYQNVRHVLAETAKAAQVSNSYASVT